MMLMIVMVMDNDIIDDMKMKHNLASQVCKPINTIDVIL